MSKSLLLISALVFAVSGCNSQSAAGPGQEKASVSWPTRRDEKNVPLPGNGEGNLHYIRSEAKSAYGSFELYRISDAYLKQRAQEAQGQRITALNLQEEFGIDAYLMEGYETPRSVLIAPRVMFNSRRHLVNSTNRDVENANLTAMIQLADAQDDLSLDVRQRLRRRLRGVLGGEPNIMVSNQCPDKIEIKSQELGSIAVKMNASTKSCPQGAFTPATILFKDGDYEKFRGSFVDGGRVSVSTHFNFSTPVTTVFGTFFFNTQAFFSLLQKNTGLSRPPLSEEALADSLNRTLSTVSSRGTGDVIPEGLFPELRAKITAEFFETTIYPDCPGGQMVCYKLKDKNLFTDLVSSMGPSGVWQTELAVAEYFGPAASFVSESGLTDSMSERAPVLLKSESTDILKPPVVAAVNSTLRTINEGDIVEFTLKNLKQSQFESPLPTVHNISNQVCTTPYSQCSAGSWSCTNPDVENYNCRSECTAGQENVCVRSHQVCVEQGECNHPCPHGNCIMGGCACQKWAAKCDGWEGRCRGYSQVCDQRRVCDRLAVPILPPLPYRVAETVPSAPNFAWSCTNQTDNRCEALNLKDEWERITTYSWPLPRPGLVERPIASSDLVAVMAGIQFEFSSGITCPVTAFDPRVFGPSRVLLTFKNSEHCHPFETPGDKSKPPTLTILNSITLPQTYKCGELWENYLGERRYTCRLPDGRVTQKLSSVDHDTECTKTGADVGIQIPFYPVTEIEAELRLVGDYFESIPKENK